MENSSLPDKPQHTESGNEIVESGVARINYNCTGSTRELSLAISHSVSIEIKWDTLREVSMSE